MSRIVCCVMLLSIAALAQSREDIFDPSAVVISTVTLEPLPDAGCGARWCGEIPSEDGGVTLRSCTDVVQLRDPANRARCTAMAAAGAPRVLQGLRFPVDGGQP